MSVTSGDINLKGINTEIISNIDLFACRLSGRLGLDLVCTSNSRQFLAFLQ